MKHTKLPTVLVFAAMLLILGLLVANVTSFSSMPPQSQEMATVIPRDGTIYHPITLDVPGPYLETWKVTTEVGMQQWLVNPVFAANVHPGTYIMHDSTEYQVSGINRKALTMSAVILGN